MAATRRLAVLKHPWPVTDRESGSAVTAKESAATVNGHAAVLTTAPLETVDAHGYPAQNRLSWKLANGRTIHVSTHMRATAKA